MGARGESTTAQRAGALVLAEWVALAVGAAVLAYQLASPDPRIGDDDFQVFYGGAAALAAGQSPYVGDFVSPPWFALALVPLSFLPLPVARVVWLALGLVLLAAATIACARLVGLRWPLRRLALIAVLSGLWPPVEFGLKLGQNSLLVWLLVLGALLAAQARRPALCGTLLALGLIKPQLVFLFAGGLVAQAAATRRLGGVLAAGGLTLAIAALAVAVVAPESYADVVALRPRPWNYWGSTVSGPSFLAALLGSPALGILLYLPVAAAGAAVVLRAWAASGADAYGRARQRDADGLGATAGAASGTESDHLKRAERGDAPAFRATQAGQIAYLGSVTACATLLLTPYAYPYDAVLLQLPLLWLIATAQRLQPPDWRRVAGLVGAAVLGLWLLERPGDYTLWRFLGLLPPLALLVAAVWARRAVS